MNPTMNFAANCLSFLAFCLFGVLAHAGEVRVATAANFAGPMQRLAVEFESRSGHRVQMTEGSTGAFFAQISNGAPFDVMLSADQARIIKFCLSMR